MWKKLTLVFALLAPSFALAEPFEDQRGNWWDLPMPPARIFDRPYTGKLTVFKLEESNLTRICSALVDKAEPFGCSIPGPTTCTIYVSADLPKKFRKAVERHELAHCHGWPETHPEE